MEIGENILFIHDGKKDWEGTKEDVFSTNDENLNDFVFASNLAKKIKQFLG
jgi:phospholipid/cholesterol/gamma-HCH transport system ATP-binding protein